MVPTDYVVSCLATLMFNEPVEDALMGYTLCGLIVRNRVLAGWEGGNWLTLISKHDLFSANPPETPRVLKFGDPQHNTVFRRTLAVAENIYNGREKDISEGALWYGRLDTCAYHFKETIVRPQNITTGLQEHAMVAKVGAQMCFK